MSDNRKLERDPMNKVIGGVCSGLADFFNLDVALVRVAFVIALLFASFGFWLYIILWVVIPSGRQADDSTRQHVNASANQQTNASTSKSTAIFSGVAVIMIGLIFLINNFIPISWIWKLWPLILVVIGILMVVNALKKGDENGQ